MLFGCDITAVPGGVDATAVPGGRAGDTTIQNLGA